MTVQPGPNAKAVQQTYILILILLGSSGFQYVFHYVIWRLGSRGAVKIKALCKIMLLRVLLFSNALVDEDFSLLIWVTDSTVIVRTMRRMGSHYTTQ